MTASSAVAEDPPDLRQGPIEFIEDFEDGNAVGWETGQPVYANGIVEAVTSPSAPNGGDYVGKVTFGSSCWGPSTAFDPIAADSVSWLFRADGSTAHPSGVAVWVRTNLPDPMMTVISYYGGHLRYQTAAPTTFPVIQPASEGVWYRIDLRNIDWTLGTFDIWVDGVEQVVAAPFLQHQYMDGAAVTGFGNYGCPGGPRNTYIDDLTVRVPPEYSLAGFYQPVEMGESVFNTVKGGATVPLKFEVFAPEGEVTDTAVVESFTVKQIACPNGLDEHFDPVEFTTTGGTSLRYSEEDGQFIQNWKTPRGPGTCYEVTLTTVDGSTLVANFMLR
jgi:hypothetical protein